MEIVKPHKVYTLILPLDIANKRVLLGLKKRGFGVGKYNGFGGKVEKGETVPEGAARELLEESHLRVPADRLKHHALLLMENEQPEAELLEIHVFIATEWVGEPKETEEMAPKWFSISSSEAPPLPLDTMWEETRLWMLPLLQIAAEETTESSSMGATASDTSGQRNRFFVHHVTFKGGKNPQTGEEDPWHGMDQSYFEWFEEEIEWVMDKEALLNWFRPWKAQLK